MIPADRATKFEELVAAWRTTTFPWSCGSCLTRVVSAYRSTRLRVRVAVRRDELDRALASGLDPGRSPELAFRAARLVQDRYRRSLARCLRLVVEQVDGAFWVARVNPRQIQQPAIRADRQALVSLIDRLENPRPVLAEGVAIAERLMTDLHSPLFAPAEPGTIRRLARHAVAAMEPGPGPHPPSPPRASP